jgi:hypothetical protein
MQRGRGGLARILGGNPRRFGGDTQTFLILSNELERFPMLISGLPGLFSQPSESLCFIPRGLGNDAMLFSARVWRDVHHLSSVRELG